MYATPRPPAIQHSLQYILNTGHHGQIPGLPILIKDVIKETDYHWGLALAGWLAVVLAATRPGATACGACPQPDGADLLPARDVSALLLLETEVPTACAAPLLGTSAGCCSPPPAPPQP
jgi:hypothetical protein